MQVKPENTFDPELGVEHTEFIVELDQIEEVEDELGFSINFKD